MAATQRETTRNDLKTESELADLLGVTPRTVARWRLEGKVPHLRVKTTIRYEVEKVLEALRRTDGRRVEGV